MAKKKQKRRQLARKPRRADYMTVPEARLYLGEWAAQVNKDVADEA